MGEEIETVIIDAFAAVILSKCKDLHWVNSFDGQTKSGRKQQRLSSFTDTIWLSSFLFYLASNSNLKTVHVLLHVTEMASKQPFLKQNK